MAALPASFFDRDSVTLARALVGTVLRRRVGAVWLAALVIEAEAYQRRERGSHASLGRTPSREALWAPPGTLYMYWSRGGDSLNISARGGGNAALFKSARPWFDDTSPRETTLAPMQALNPARDGSARAPERLCAGQTLLCRTLDLRIAEWNGRAFDPERFYLDDVGYRPTQVVQARRLGIAVGRDEHLPWRFVDADHARQCTANPLTKRAWRAGHDYWVLGPRDRTVERT